MARLGRAYTNWAILGALILGGATPQTATAQVATLTLAGVAGTTTGGPVTQTAQVATITLEGVAGTPSTPAGSQSTTAQVATITLTGVAGTTTGGPVTQTAQVATITLTAVPAAFVLYPASVSSRKWLDQHGDVFLLKCMSSWGMAQELSDANITIALEDAAARGFNAVNVAMFGNNYGAGWDRYTNAAAEAAFTGSPYASSLGAAWGTVDHIVEECTRLGMVAVLSLYTGFGTYGNEADVISAGTTNMYNFGVDVATRYASYRNIVWHLGADDNWTYGTGPYAEVEAYFDGIKDTEGGTNGTRLVIAEANNGSSTYSQWPSAHTGTGGFSRFRLDANSIYDYTSDSVVNVDAIYTESGATSYAVWDCEPAYKGADHYSATESVEMQNQRERNYSVFLRGGIGINFGHEDWWPFGATGLYSDGIAWTAVMDSLVVVEASYAWTLIDAYCADTTWAPSADGGFLNTGVGSGDTKAAVGLSDTAALVYFPNTRASIEVDTTLLTGTGNVRLRWYDPTAGTYTSIATSEAQNATRSITYPTTNSNSSGADDWVLVVDLTGDQTLTAQVASITLTGVAGTTTGGPVTQTAQVGSLTLTGVVGTPTVGNVTVTAQVASIVLTGVAGTSTGGPTSLTAQVADLILTGIAGSPSTGGAGPQSVTAQIATLTLSGVAGVTTGGPVTVTAQVATLTLSGVAGTPSTPAAGSQSVTAQVAVLTLSGIPGTSTGGPTSLTAQVATLTLSGVAGYGYVGVLILPADRTYIVRADRRFYVIDADDRTVLIPTDNRQAVFT